MLAGPGPLPASGGVWRGASQGSCALVPRGCSQGGAAPLRGEAALMEHGIRPLPSPGPCLCCRRTLSGSGSGSSYSGSSSRSRYLAPLAPLSGPWRSPADSPPTGVPTCLSGCWEQRELASAWGGASVVSSSWVTSSCASLPSKQQDPR